jgi:hypothetical protein
MIRTINIFLAVMCMAALTGVYTLKHWGDELAQTKADLAARIEHQKGDLSLLQADWAYLNQPGHVEPIIQRHQQAFNLAPATATQFLPIDAIPMRPQQPDSAALDDLFKSLASGVDPANTGTGGH